MAEIEDKVKPIRSRGRTKSDAELELLKAKRDLLKAKADLKIYNYDRVIDKEILSGRLFEIKEKIRELKEEIKDPAKSKFVYGKGGMLEELSRQNNIKDGIMELKKDNRELREEVNEINKDIGSTKRIGHVANTNIRKELDI
jgi:hypothetical protein